MDKVTRLIKLSYLALFLFTPLIFTSFNSELFELPKMHLVYFLSSLILCLHLINVLNKYQPLIKKTPLNLPLFLFLISQIISTVLSVDPHTSVYGYYSRLNGGLLSVMAYITLYLIAVIYFDEQFKDRILTITLISGFIVSSYGILEHFGIDKHMWVQDVQNRVFSTLGQPNWLAAYLCVIIPFSLHRLLRASNTKQFITYYLISSNYYLCLLFTKSKSGLIAAAISLLIFFGFHLLWQLKQKKLKANFLFIIISILSLSILVNNPIKDLIFRQVDPPSQDVGNTINITPSQDIRKIVWQGALDLWRQFPLFGTGTETFAYSYYWTRPVAHNVTSEWDFLYNKAHNEYLNYLSTTGAFGLAAYSIFIIAVLLLTYKTLKTEHRSLTLPLLAAFISILITNFAGFSVVITSLFFFVLPALALPKNSNPKNYSKIKPLSFLPLLLLVFLSQKILFSYLADITYAESLTLDAQNDYPSALEKISLSLNYKKDPLYYSKASTMAAKIALMTNDPEHKQNYINQSVNYSDISVNISPANTNFWKERAQVYYYLSTINSEYFLESIQSLLKVSHLAPTDAKTYYLIGKFLDAVGQKDEAVSYYQQAIVLKPNYDHAYYNLANIYHSKNDWGKTVEYLNLTLQYAPNNVEAQELLDQLKATGSPR
ncbi:MAG: O-antigen ligase family protein [Patescibacteria group bacterium]|jgi:putative inorganic carbon (HCO3(-)) transporter